MAHAHGYFYSYKAQAVEQKQNDGEYAHYTKTAVHQKSAEIRSRKPEQIAYFAAVFSGLSAGEDRVVAAAGGEKTAICYNEEDGNEGEYQTGNNAYSFVFYESSQLLVARFVLPYVFNADVFFYIACILSWCFYCFAWHSPICIKKPAKIAKTCRSKK